jgi:phospholipid/cholesterol/gamma-HCH transport system substrate-binding protein
MTSRLSDVLLGLFFFAALIGLGVITIVLSDYRFGEEQFDVKLLSPDVGYLRPGDPVLLYGMPTGTVRSIERLPQTRAVTMRDNRVVQCSVQISIRTDTNIYDRLPVDSTITIEDRGLLGGKLIRMDVGVSDVFETAEGPLVALPASAGFTAIGEMISENRTNLRQTLDNLASITSDIDAGQGALGALLHNKELESDVLAMGKDARAVVENAREVTDSLRAGGGLLGKLIYDEPLADDTQSAVNSARTFFDEAADVFNTVNRGEGTLGRLVHDDTMYDRANVFFDDMASLSTNLREGDGLLGALLADEELADDFKAIVQHSLGAIEDARESSPVSGLGSFIFGTF